jgi:hypothetical protein
MHRAHHVVPNAEGGWDVKQEGEFEVVRHFREKARAIGFARDLSRIEHTELVVYDEDGNIEEKDLYGPDPAWRSS